MIKTEIMKLSEIRQVIPTKNKYFTQFTHGRPRTEVKKV